MRWMIPVLAAGLLGACASRPPANDPVPTYGSTQGAQVVFGRVIGIETLRGTGQSSQTTGTGAVVGGVTGAIIGRQFGDSNSGKNTGTVLGAIAGAVIGNEIEKDRAETSDRTRITVQVDRGGKRFFVHPDGAGLRLGDRVRIVGDRLYRY